MYVCVWVSAHAHIQSHPCFCVCLCVCACLCVGVFLLKYGILFEMKLGEVVPMNPFPFMRGGGGGGDGGGGGKKGEQPILSQGKVPRYGYKKNMKC